MNGRRQSEHVPVVLHGRQSECRTIDHLIREAHGGASGTLVLRGEAGIGKSALLEYAATSSLAFRVLRTTGLESEMELPFAALHQLCAPLLDGLQGLPRPQRDALQTTFGLRGGEPPDRFLVGLAVLTLMSSAAGQRPLICLVDDAQWLDRASAEVLGFVARRVLAEPLVILFATRENRAEVSGLPELELSPLRDGDAHELLKRVLPSRLDRRVRDRVVAESHGNPLALIELPRDLTATQLAGGFGLVDAERVPERIEENFVDRVNRLPEFVQLFVLLAAADFDGDPLVVARAATRLGIPVDAAAERAQSERLLVIHERVVFRHPLVRSGVYRAAPHALRRVVHAALADSIDGTADPDRRAWHHAAAATDRDDEVAAELEAAAGRAEARGGVAAAAAFLQRAASLTVDGQHRSTRMIAAARASNDAADFGEAKRLLQIVRRGPLDPLRQGQVDLLTGQIAFASGSTSEAPNLLLLAAQQLQTLAPNLARRAYLLAWGAAAYESDAAHVAVQQELSRGALALPQDESDSPSVRLLIEGLARLTMEGPAAAAPTLRAAGALFADDSLPTADLLDWGWLASAASNALWDIETTQAISRKHVAAVRQRGALGQLPFALTSLSTVTIWLGDFAEGASLIAEANILAEAGGGRLPPHAELRLWALRGAEANARALISSSLEHTEDAGQGMLAINAQWAAAVLHNGLGNYRAAAEAATRATAGTYEPWVSMWALPELIEAATRLGQDEIARDAMARLMTRADACDTPLSNGVTARSRALVHSGDAADALYRGAIESLQRTKVRPELARAHLLYGEWLRRQGRRADAKEQLRTALTMLTDIGMDGFAERARRELAAAGESSEKPASVADPTDELTDQERQIALLVQQGLSNPEVGERLFLSARTIEWHLRKIFIKLGISSRRQLRDMVVASREDLCSVT